jgi:hypothetical protein
MYIEDLINTVTNTASWVISGRHVNIDWAASDSAFLNSIAEQYAFHNTALTEKQAHAVIKILDKNRDKIRPYVSNIDDILSAPLWKNPFRVLPTISRISIAKHNQPARYFNGECIHVEFPFDHTLVEVIRKRNSELHDLHKGHWDSNLKAWIFGFTEKNILWLGELLLPRGFQSDAPFLKYYTQATDAFANIENHMPMLVNTAEGYQIVNAHPKVPQPNTHNVIEALFWARDYGIIVWDNDIEQQLIDGDFPVTKTILSVSNRKHPWVNSSIHELDVFSDLLNYGGPALVIVPGGSEYTLIKSWHAFAKRVGISDNEISVMFRLPNDQAEFNHYVKDAGLNNPVSESTRLVFVSTKITKPLIKSGVKFDTVINLGYYNYMHFTMSTVVDNAVNLVYYSMKAPTKNNKWQPREL